MAKRIASALLTITIAVFCIDLIFGWLNANVDSYFYWAIGAYFRTGVYPFIEPFIYLKPTTISPPLYGILLNMTTFLTRADILVHSVQLILLTATSYLLYQVLRLHVKTSIAIIITCLFAIWPVNIIYASLVMTENISQFMVMAWIYLVVRGLTHKQTLPIAAAVLVASIATLIKYNLGIFTVFAGLLLLPKLRRLKAIDIGVLCLSGAIFTGWIFVNHSVTGVWGLYDTRGTQLYNQFVAETKILPPETHPAVIRMRALLPTGTDIAVPYWDLQQALTNALHRDWLAVDRVLFDVAWASVSTHPMQYIGNSVVNFARVHYDHVPYWRNLANVGKTISSDMDRPYCGAISSIQMCAPIISTPWSYALWDTWITWEMRVFEVTSAAFFYIVLLPVLLVSLLFQNARARLYALMYLTGVIPIALTIHSDPRYIVPFYPIQVLLVVTATMDYKTHKTTATPPRCIPYTKWQIEKS